MSTISLLRRVLRRDVAGLDAIIVTVEAPWVLKAYVRPKEGHAYETVRADTERVLNREIHVGCVFHVYPLDDDLLAQPPPAVSAKLEIAALANDQMQQWQYLAGLVRAVPKLARLVTTRRKQGGSVLYVADYNNKCEPDFLAEVRQAVHAVSFAGASIQVEPLNPTDIRNDLDNAGFLMPRRDRRLVDTTESDDDRFVTRVRRLVDNDSSDSVRHVDDFLGTKLFSTQSFGQPLPLHCLLAYYDRVYVKMPFGPKPHEHTEKDDQYFQREFGIQAADFLEFCKAGRVIPVFNANLGHYPASVANIWLERLDLPFLTPRDLDYLAARFIWRTNAALRTLRRDRASLRALAQAYQKLSEPGTAPQNVVRQIAWLLHAADAFEGLIFHRGTAALGNISTAAPIAFAIDHVADSLPSKDTSFTLSLEGFGAVHDILLAQAFDASLNEAMLLNDQILTMVVGLLRSSSSADVNDHSAIVRSLHRLIPAMDLHFASDIPAREYLDLFDQAETRRVRSLVARFLSSTGTSPRPSDDELREGVQQLNNAVDRIRRNAVEVAVVDIVGDLATAGSAAVSNKLLGSALGTAKQSWMKAAMNRIGDALVEDSFLGGKLDSIRDALNGVPAGAIRIYKLRRKMGRS